LTNLSSGHCGDAIAQIVTLDADDFDVFAQIGQSHQITTQLIVGVAGALGGEVQRAILDE
jgi:hypothetical protein